MPKLFLPHDSPPELQTRCGLRVPGSKSNQGAFFDYPHAHNLYSLAGLVNANNHPTNARLDPELIQAVFERDKTRKQARPKVEAIT